VAFEDFVEPLWNAPLDLSTALSHIEESATLAGMFFQAVVEGARQAGVTLRSARERYTRFKFYPQTEFAQLLVEGAGIFYPGIPLREALRKMGHSAPHAMIESTMGRVIFGSVEGVAEVITAMAKTYPLNVRPCVVEVTDTGQNYVLVRLQNIGYFLDSHHIGVFEGTLTYAGVRGSIRIRSHGPKSADYLCSW
jgi:uncharacterized protein (TIGR02265 family)